MDYLILYSIVFSAFKLLFIPLYRSTDFEVHRNWLAITHSLPLKQWYYEARSEWTLDYPPLFAWFEWCLSHGARLFDAKMLNVDKLEYHSYATIVYQRLTVILTDYVFVYAVYRLCGVLERTRMPPSLHATDRSLQKSTLFILLISNVGLIIVDHIHFQYNGFLFGVWFLSLVGIFEGRPYWAAFWFSMLLNLKHIYLYVAPVYFIYLLQSFCLKGTDLSNYRIQWRSLMVLGSVVISVFAVSFGPFIYLGQLSQVMSRLFPFKRGLCHAYWAPNFWVFYNCVDKASFWIGSRLGLVSTLNSSSVGVMTGGLVQEFEHQVLPSILPRTTMLLVILSILPSLYMLWQRPASPLMFLRCVILCAFGSFLFGWHVHEKAILLVILPFTILAVYDCVDGQTFILLSHAGHYSLHPLLFTPFEIPLKYLLLLLYLLLSSHSLQTVHGSLKGQKPLKGQKSLKGQKTLKPDSDGSNWIRTLETVYMWSVLPLEVFTTVGYRYAGLGQLEFLPLLATSVYSAVGIMYCWVKFNLHCWQTLQQTRVKQW